MSSGASPRSPGDFLESQILRIREKREPSFCFPFIRAGTETSGSGEVAVRSENAPNLGQREWSEQQHCF